ncbi:MAG: hypothetical protein WAL52_06895 [Candidatus Sulfotelmatobacter sp.]
MQDRNNLIPRGSGWDLQQALAIKVVGQIVGRGTVHGQQPVFLLTPWRAANAEASSNVSTTNIRKQHVLGLLGASVLAGNLIAGLWSRPFI